MRESNIVIALALFGLMCFLLLMVAAVWLVVLVVEHWLDRDDGRCSCGRQVLPPFGPMQRVLKDGIIHEPARCHPQREEMA